MKKVSESIVVMHELVLPNDTNVLGNVLGGRVMHLIDICAAMSAYKHARSPVVTASIDHLNFLTPAKKGDILILKSSVNYVSTTSMEIGVRVESENTISGKIKKSPVTFLFGSFNILICSSFNTSVAITLISFLCAVLISHDNEDSPTP